MPVPGLHRACARGARTLGVFSARPCRLCELTLLSHVSSAGQRLAVLPDRRGPAAAAVLLRLCRHRGWIQVCPAASSMAVAACCVAPGANHPNFCAWTKHRELPGRRWAPIEHTVGKTMLANALLLQRQAFLSGRGPRVVSSGNGRDCVCAQRGAALGGHACGVAGSNSAAK